MIKKRTTEEKKNGRIYTPNFVVCNILDMVGYNNKNIIKKNIIDNSCGDGSFLKEIVKRYCEIALKNNFSIKEIKQDLENHIFGIELDELECNKCKKNLSNVAALYDIKNVHWNIICGNALKINNYNKKMDFVVGNPPYVRVHNLENLDEIKTFDFAKEGMTDLYIVFFEVGIKMLNEKGILGYITPSSYFTSKSSRAMRNYIVKYNLLTDIVDFKHTQLFNATTYSCITILNMKNMKDDVKYFEYDSKKQKPFLVEELSSKDYIIDHCFYFSKKESLCKLKAILSFTPLFNKNYIAVKNGFATLLDKFFIQDNLPFTDYIIPILKSSTGKWKQCFFPYKNGTLISLKTLQENENIKNYYATNIDLLKKRTNENPLVWWGFGRSQGLKDVDKTKYSLNSLVKTLGDVKLIECPPGTGVYSGLYIVTDFNFDKVRNVLVSENFIQYVALLGKYKSGGYYTFSSTDVKKFLDYYLLKG